MGACAGPAFGGRWPPAAAPHRPARSKPDAGLAKANPRPTIGQVVLPIPDRRRRIPADTLSATGRRSRSLRGAGKPPPPTTRQRRCPPPRLPRSARRRSPSRSKRRSCTATARTGAASSARSSRSRPPTATSAWARWAAAARTPRGRSPRSPATFRDTTSSGSRRCASRSATPPRACTTTARSCTRRSSSRASTSWARSSACPCTRFSAASCATRWSSRATCSSATTTRTRSAAKCARRSSSSRMPARSRRQHGFRVHKLKGGVYPPAHELACYRALAGALPGDRFRYDPNSALSLADAIDFGRGIEDIAQRLFRGSGLGHAAARAPQGVRADCRSRPTRSSSTSSSSRRTCETRAVDVDPARHHVLGRHPPLHQGRRRVRDDGPRRRRAQLGRARHPARDDAAPGRRGAESGLRGGRALPPPRSTT